MAQEQPSLEGISTLNQIESLATKRLSKKAWAFNYAGSGDLISKNLNASVYNSILLRPRIFINVRECDLSTTILGAKVGLPIFVSPMAMACRFHEDGEKGITTACRDFGVMHFISNNASMTPEEIVEGAGPGQAFGYQLYVQQDRRESEAVLERINKLDAITCIVLTVDEPVPGKHGIDTDGEKLYRDLNPDADADVGEKDNGSADGTGGPGIRSVSGPASDLTWEETLDWLSNHTTLPIILKGVQTHEDARIASLYTPQVRGIILSNHGGRVLDTAPPAIHTLLEIRKHCPEILEKMDVMVDGGIRRGTDVVKALCLGAKAVGIGRPVLSGLGASGVAGVQRTLEILANEIKSTMQLLGVQSVSELGPQHVNTKIVEQQLYDGVGDS
ncbi:FMN-dependent dehydrogenase [Aspergillus cavernicola]|uniref:FMN-dependent dehydrogenase n=1 Tax=Aspergillus cavernicola TaxID=176166 RepID=A0ABR4HCP9_9EURO